ncbi:PREDICTED: beta-1,3-galactosyltransferase 1-like isoform X2 [Acropora digitifera]|uniref:beta-1,3-galactosyltransferase 1-like isoform X2 n=1 Tax=Acropora digitifera TaxID=70779 RepID=UPI00077A2ECA|nr:PREDICTED: beta-1,3-galactosyltransferase 1-like isoform X2 [Acropora digitifera]
MPSKKVMALKVFIILMIMILIYLRIMAELKAPQPVSPRRSYEVTNVRFREEKSKFHQSQRQLPEVNSVFTIVPELPHNLNVLLIINTIPLETERRNILRQTWARQSSWTLESQSSFPDSDDIVDIGYFFMMGFHRNPCIDQSVKDESQIHRDILRANLTESYRGLINKVLLTFEWVTNLDTKPRFIVKADHDIYVKIPWYVSKEDYSEEFFPPYCGGPFYILSQNLFLHVMNASKVIKPFAVEDAYMAVLVKKMGVEPHDSGRYLVNWDRTLNDEVLKTPEDKIKIPSGVVLGDSISSVAIKLIHRVYMRG